MGNGQRILDGLADAIEHAKFSATVRQAIVAAFLEGGDCAWTAYVMAVNEDEKQIDAGAEAEAFADLALPQVMAALGLAAIRPAHTSGDGSQGT